MRKILVTGAGGYIGSIATYTFLQNGFEVVAIDNFSTGFRQPLTLMQKMFGKYRIRYYAFDLREDLKAVFNSEKEIEAVVHFAGSCSVDESMKDPQKYFSNHVLGSQILLSEVLDAGIRNFIFSSTCAVYGDVKYSPVDEKNPTNPKNPYGQSKLMVEQLIDWYGKLSGLRYIVLRYFNVCGASDDGLLGDSKKPSIHLVQNVVRSVLGLEPFYLTCPKVETADGTPIRDYINVMDVNMAHLKALEYLLGGGKNDTINLGTGRGYSVLEIIEEVQRCTGLKVVVNRERPRKGEYPQMLASINKAKKVLGWYPRRTLQDSIKSLMLWYKVHPKGWSR